jgi:RNA polymerase sigma-70 factor, ECF subfamily
MDNQADAIPELSGVEIQGADELFLALYNELRRLASRIIQNERPNHTLQTTALVHEAWLKLNASLSSRSNSVSALSREHFMARAAVVMRRILINHAKSKKRLKRGGGAGQYSVEEVAVEFNDRAIDLLALDDELKKLEQLDPRQFRIVEMRFFGGLSVEECAKILAISVRSAYLDWAHARAWLRSRLETDP